MQYFQPNYPYFVGDCMPFYHEGTFYLYYLLDEGHHRGKNGLGGHQWAVATTEDLVTWIHHPLALPITEPWEGSICTGSTLFHNGRFYAFYATRKPDWTEHLSVATSDNPLAFTKNSQVPFIPTPAGYQSRHCRDPFVFYEPEGGLFHMLVTSALEDFSPALHSGCLIHLTSPDLKNWEVAAPFLVPGYPTIPECADYFEWNGRYYLIFSVGGVAHYRIADAPLGPWQRPLIDTLDGPMVRVMKTAAFHNNRRLGAAFLISLADERDDGDWLWAGKAIVRELVQLNDGTLGTCFVPEMLPQTGEPIALEPAYTLEARNGFAATRLDKIPINGRVRMRILVEGETAVVGLILRSSLDGLTGYTLRFSLPTQQVDLRPATRPDFAYEGRHGLENVLGLKRPFTVDILLVDDVIDVCINGRRCLINRFPEHRGSHLHLFCQNGSARFTDVTIQPLQN